MEKGGSPSVGRRPSFQITRVFLWLARQICAKSCFKQTTKENPWNRCGSRDIFCLRTSIWIFTTREIWPSGRRHFCAIQAFCRRQNLSAGGIHSRRACKIHCGIHKKDAGAKLYFTAVSEFQDITRNWVLD